MNIFSLMKGIEQKTKARCLSSEGEIITYLYEYGPSRPFEIVNASTHSGVNVFSKLSDLCKIGVLERAKKHERARPIYSLSSEFKLFIDAQVAEKVSAGRIV